jgi:hypothetical protein
MSIPRNLGAFADNVTSTGTLNVTGINATGTPSSTTVLYGNGTWATAGATPAGSNTQIQYNNSGAFGASANLTYSGTTLTQIGRLTVNNASGTDGGFRLSSTGDVSFYDFEVSDSLGLEIQQGNTPRLTINTSGNIKNWGSLSVGNVTPTTSGIGITFPATQSASSDANTLDDYEEGTWTPAPVSLTVVGTPTYTGKYTKIGNQVTCWATIDSTTSTMASGGSTSIGGLPFTASAISGSSSGAGTSISSNGVNQVGGGYIFTGNNRFYVSGWTATANIIISITYQV